MHAQSPTYLCADDIRTLSSSVTSLNAQISGVVEFIKRNFLQLNPNKVKLSYLHKKSKITPPSCDCSAGKVDLLNILDTSGTMIYLPNLRSSTMSTRQESKKVFIAKWSHWPFSGWSLTACWQVHGWHVYPAYPAVWCWGLVPVSKVPGLVPGWSQ